MNLPDFAEFVEFKQLRDLMGVKKAGTFELFDGDLQLTSSERELLKKAGIVVKYRDCSILEDNTLALKNSRVILYHPEPRYMEHWHFHVANCDVLSQQGVNSPDSPWLAMTGENTHPHGVYSICSECLHKIQYQGYDNLKHRHLEYSKKVLREFTLDEYLKEYPFSF